MLENYFKELHEALNTNEDLPDNVFAVLPLDMVSALLQSQGRDLAPYIQQSNFGTLFGLVMQNLDYAMDLSKFALVGDLARFVPEFVAPIVHEVYPILLAGTDHLLYYAGMSPVSD